MVLILDWIEARGKEVITADSLRQMKSDTMIELDPLQVARELWSWIDLTLEHSSSAPELPYEVYLPKCLSKTNRFTDPSAL